MKLGDRVIITDFPKGRIYRIADIFLSATTDRRLYELEGREKELFKKDELKLIGQ